MRVYFVSSGLQGCYYYRCLSPMITNGWDGDQTSINIDEKTPESKTIAAKEADVVVFHRPDDDRKLKLARLLKSAGKKIVYDNDDTYKDDNGFKINAMLDKERMDRNMQTANQALDAFISEADLVTASTEFLAEEYRKLNPNVVVLPNFIDPFMFDEPLRNEDDTVRVGFTGSVGCTADFELAVDLINRAPEFTWVMYSLPAEQGSEMYQKLYYDEYQLLKKINIEWHPFTKFPEYYQTLNELRLDIMVIPRQDTYFNRCKSNVKFLEAAMFEIPVIAQGFPDDLSPYQVDPEDAEHMIICNTQDEFESALRDLAGDKEKRRAMGKRARAYVEEKYDINNSNNSDLWKKAYQKLFQSQS